eukprot:GHVR01071118.1.p2 GENE.GHVR01071118.1~~GHVR01071118.1.p2  ORF type:complete len:151 (+),score=6.92 GHVR01071118.1:400-852(+)
MSIRKRKCAPVQIIDAGTVFQFLPLTSPKKGWPMHRFTTDRLDSDSLGARLTRSRLRHGWTQHELAHNVGTSQAVVQRIETGKCRHPRNIDRIADVLDVSPAWLMYGAEVMDGLEPEAIETAKAWANLTEPHRTALKEMIIKIAEEDVPA